MILWAPRQAFWDPMHDYRKAVLISGLLVLIVARVMLRKKRAARESMS